MIRQESALVYIVEILLISNFKPHKLQLIKQLHDIANRENVNLAPERSFFMLLIVKHLGHKIVFNAIKPVVSKTVAIHEMLSATTKTELMRFNSSRKHELEALFSTN